jgi:uncharacterized protein with PIN domain/sulfur carrier protein ThiS
LALGYNRRAQHSLEGRVRRVTLRFYQELNDFLPSSRRQRDFVHTVSGRASVKDVIESLGVPHTEVDLLLVNGQSVGFSHPVEDGDRISVYPTFEALDIRDLARLRPSPLREPRFVLDAHLGRLTAYLRLFGFDSLYDRAWSDAHLAALAAEHSRILLTRDRGLLKRKVVTRGYCPRSDHPRDQLVEVLRRFDLREASRPFTRCMACNGLLAHVPPGEVIGRVPPSVAHSQHTFSGCAACGRLYWQGSHYARLAALVTWAQENT